MTVGIFIQFYLIGFDYSATPLLPSSTIASFEVLGTIMFAFTYVVTIPSWCNEKKVI